MNITRQLLMKQNTKRLSKVNDIKRLFMLTLTEDVTQNRSDCFLILC